MQSALMESEAWAMSLGAGDEPCDVCLVSGTFRPVVTISLLGVFDAEIHGCSACEFRQVRPRLNDRELRRLYPESYFDPRTPIGFSAYAREEQRAEREAYFVARELRELGGRGRVLEVGAALGFFLEALRRYSSLEVAGIDISDFAAYFARRRYGLPVQALTLEQARFPDCHFDLIVQKDLLEHVLRPRDHLLETLRILKPGGRVRLVTPNGEANLRPLVRQARKEREKGTGRLPMLDQGHLSFFSRENLRRLFGETGFEVVRIRNVHLKRGLRALGYLPRKRGHGKLVPSGRVRETATTETEVTLEPPGETAMAALYDRLVEGLDAFRRRHRSHPAYFEVRHAMEAFDALPEALPLGLDFDCVLRRPA